MQFQDKWVSMAESILKKKEAKDNGKSLDYIMQINDIINRYNKMQLYTNDTLQNCIINNYLIHLDQTIRLEYPFCDKLDDYIPRQHNSRTYVSYTGPRLPNELRRLHVDKYGILYTVLYNKCLIKTIEDFIAE